MNLYLIYTPLQYLYCIAAFGTAKHRVIAQNTQLKDFINSCRHKGLDEVFVNDIRSKTSFGRYLSVCTKNAIGIFELPTYFSEFEVFVSPYNYGLPFQWYASELKLDWNSLYLIDDGIGNLIKIKNQKLFQKKLIAKVTGKQRYEPAHYRLAADQRSKNFITIYPDVCQQIGGSTQKTIIDVRSDLSALLKRHSSCPSFVTPGNGIWLMSNRANYSDISVSDYIDETRQRVKLYEDRFQKQIWLKPKYDDRYLDEIMAAFSETVLSPFESAELLIASNLFSTVITPLNSTYTLAKALDFRANIYCEKDRSWQLHDEKMLAVETLFGDVDYI